MEVIKQAQYKPIEVEKQVILIYAANNEYLEKIAVDDINKYEEGLYKFMDENYPEIGLVIKESGELSDETKEKLNKALDEYTKDFVKDNKDEE
jgi:F-type H+-transporting ATPase subunit alpha